MTKRGYWSPFGNWVEFTEEDHAEEATQLRTLVTGKSNPRWLLHGGSESHEARIDDLDGEDAQIQDERLM